MNNLFRLEVDLGYGGYGYTDTFDELLCDVEREYGEHIKSEVEEWALSSVEDDEFIKDWMYIINISTY